MPGDRRRLVPRLPAKEPQPPREVHILLLHEEVPVEDLPSAFCAREASVPERTEPVGWRRAVRSPYGARDGMLGSIWQSARATDRAAVAPHGQPCRIDHRAALAVCAELEDASLDGCRIVVPLEGGHHAAKVAWIQ